MAGVNVTVPYTPRRWAMPMHASFRRWFAVVMHRRGGKTTSWLNHHQRAACDDAWERRRLKTLEPKFTASELDELVRLRVYAHILPSLTQARAVAWEPLKFISAEIPGAKANERDMSITYPSPKGSLRVVRLWGADNIDGLRGIALSGLSLDEFSQHPPGVFGEVLSKALADHLGYCAFLGTIKGKNQLFKTYEAAKHDPAWFALWQDVDKTLATEEGATIRAIRIAMKDDLALIEKGLMTQEEYDQEWFLSPHAAIKGAYYARQLVAAHKDHRIRAVPYDPALPVYDVWDLGAGPNMAVGMFQRSGRQMALIDYLEGQASDGLPQIIGELQKKPYVWGKHFAPHDIRATDLSTGKTRVETAKALGWPFEVVQDIGVDDGINAVRLLLARLWIDETAGAKVVEALGQYRRVWVQSTGQFGDKPVHDWASHPADMLRYAAVAEDQMKVTAPKGRTPPRKRERFASRATGASGKSDLRWLN